MRKGEATRNGLLKEIFKDNGVGRRCSKQAENGDASD